MKLFLWKGWKSFYTDQNVKILISQKRAIKEMRSFSRHFNIQ